MYIIGFLEDQETITNKIETDIDMENRLTAVKGKGVSGAG